MKRNDRWERLNDFLIVEDAYLAAEEKARRAAQEDPGIEERIETVTQAIEEEFEDFRQMLEEIAESPALPSLAAKTMLYQITLGLIDRGETEPFLPVAEALCRHCGLACGREQLRYALQCGKPLFETEGVLNGAQCGTFWMTLIACFYRELGAEEEPPQPQLEEVFEQAEKFYRDFADEGAKNQQLARNFERYRKAYYQQQQE